MSHELALQKALIAHLGGDADMTAMLGQPARIWDAAPGKPAFPYLMIGRSESRPVAADGGGVEHALTLTVVSDFRGTEEAKAILSALRSSLADAALAADGVRTVSLRLTFADVYPAPDGLRTFAVLRVRAVTEEY
ncbi:DUF3168 domain-containing protein [Roseibacterium beibuensis]|uniref:DUF3168 domain-containing protein n=1 Tax=[Roseibacterium] beibuensis TaxID=1193142 RepID=UPI00217D6CE1|nr:DUF3168 domain-containing protein [Roseibacterium beibuensis]MCS6622776.1 DUF3168 domain-containing protein [Roseibacterium beibuensis]